jgi:predicted enzyme related to lactoylglutathione lyase
MAEFEAYAPGTFCWVDSGSTDPEAARAFYAALFGWEEDTRTMPDGSQYTEFRKGGKPVAGLYGLSEEQRRMGLPSHWMSYVSVDDAGAALDRAAAAGGSPLGPVTDIPDAGRMGLFTDPTGAVCAVWQPRGRIGARLANEHGTLIWNELLTDDPDRAAAFYGEVFGWRHEVQEMPAGPYHLFKEGEEFRGGMMAITPQMGEMPPNWSIYLAVDDLDAATARVGELGGAVEGSVIEAAGVGRMAVTRDPAGAYFMMMEPAQAA